MVKVELRRDWYLMCVKAEEKSLECWGVLVLCGGKVKADRWEAVETRRVLE